jgi:hypothetical protein
VIKNENIMKKILLLTPLLSVICTIQNCNITDKIHSERGQIYITPRKVMYGWYDNGVHQFELKKESIKVPYSLKSYPTLIIKDSIYELFYIEKEISSDLFINLTLNSENCEWEKRILIITAKGDTSYIDCKYNVIIRGKSYKISEKLKIFIEECMPTEMKENWIHTLF